jgi:hypothetical protein
MTDTDRAAFAKGVNEAIKALRAVYGGVRVMLEELETALESEPAPLASMRVRAIPPLRKDKAEEKTLRSWMGRLFTDPGMTGDDDEEVSDADTDDEAAGKSSTRTLKRGQDLAYVKVELYRPEAEASEPQILYGILRDCRMAADEGLSEFEVKAYMFSRVFEPIHEDSRAGDLKTRVKVMRAKGGKGAKTKGRNQLTFTLDSAPKGMALFDLRSVEDVQGIAADIKALWTATDGTTAPGA